MRQRRKPQLTGIPLRLHFPASETSSPAIQMPQSPVLPFVVKIPNKEMREAMRQAETGEGLVEYESLDDMEAEWNDDEQGRSR